MSERVVDLLEAVEIDDEDTDAIAAPSCSEQRLPAPVEIQRAIGQPGQAVMQREILRLGRVPPQAFRRARDDREERGPQECNSGQQDQRKRAEIVGDRRRDRGVRHVHLEDRTHAAA